MALSLEKSIVSLGRKRDLSELEDLINAIETEKLVELTVNKIGQSDAFLLWNYVLMGFSTSNESVVNKRFAVVFSVLKQLNVIELTTKQNFDIVTRLFIELRNFTSLQLIELCEYCVDCIRIGDTKCIGWKDLLPELVKYIFNEIPVVQVNDIKMSSNEYRQQIITNLLTMKWSIGILTPLANMFRDFIIVKDERIKILGKLCNNMKKLSPMEMPAFSFQLFTICTTSGLIIIPILGLQKYFYKKFYKKILETIDSEITDYDSIDNYSEKEFREAEDTILYHLSTCTEFKVTEKEVVAIFKNLSATPEYILTPFMLGSILTMCNINRYPDATRLSSSIILPFLRNIIKNNEDEKEILNETAWCRNAFDKIIKINFVKILEILIEQNHNGMDCITPGLVALSFILLRTKNSKILNSMGIQFLQKFLHKRFIFANGIIKNLADFLLADQETLQYSECLTTLSQTNTLTVSECLDTIQNILDYFLLISGENAMRMMSFIFPIVKISTTIRDSFIDILRKAMYHKNLSTRQMGVYGFCMLLKQLKNNNSRRGNGNTLFNMTQGRISGLSLMTQATLCTRDNPQRHFDMLALEIIGILRKCFSQTLEIKEILYESLTRAVEFNPKVTAHILQFIDWHFRSYFNIDELNFEIKFEQIIKQENTDDIEVIDNIGLLTYFIGFCIFVCDKYCLTHDNNIIKKLMEALLNRIDNITLENLGNTGTLDQRMNIIGCQYLNCLEALMAYASWMTKPDNQFLARLLKLFKYHTECLHNLKTLSTTNKKGNIIKKGKTDTVTSQNIPLSQIQRFVIFKPVNIWELSTMERMIKILYEPNIQFATINQTSLLRSNIEFNRYILKITSERIEGIQYKPDYHYVQNSNRTFNLLSQIAKNLYKNSIIKLIEICNNFDTSVGYLTLDCFKQCLSIGNIIYNRKFNDLIKIIIPEVNTNENVETIVKIFHSLLEKFFDKEITIEDDTETNKIPTIILQCLEILYKHILITDKFSLEIYNWLYKISLNENIDTKNMTLLFKLLFEQRIRTQEMGQFFEIISIQMEIILGQIIDEKLEKNIIKYKSITTITVEQCSIYLLNCFKNQIDIIEYFILKVKSLHAKLKIDGQGEQENCKLKMKLMERTISTQLIHITNTIIHLSNTQLPLGQSMNLLMKLIIQLFVCLTNLTKHFMQRQLDDVEFSLRSTNFIQLIRCVGKPFANKVYSLISHIEYNSLPEEAIDKNSKIDEKFVSLANKVKVLKETKLLPRLVLRIETFNKFIILFSKKTKNDLSSYLHIGTVRDFKIKTDKLKEAIKNNNNCNDNENDSDSDATVWNEDDENKSTTIDETINDNCIDELPLDSQKSSESILPNASLSTINKEEKIRENLEKINSRSSRTTTTKKPIKKIKTQQKTIVEETVVVEKRRSKRTRKSTTKVLTDTNLVDPLNLLEVLSETSDDDEVIGKKRPRRSKRV